MNDYTKATQPIHSTALIEIVFFLKRVNLSYHCERPKVNQTVPFSICMTQFIV